jgi:diguanylate cyclase (GGDEF)-like protein
MKFKDYMKGLLYVSRDVPTAVELEMLKEGRERVGLVIRARWIVLGILATYGIIPYIYFQHSSADISEITSLHCVIPIIAWCVVAVYNSFFHFSYKKFANIRPLNQIQLLLDLFFVTVVVHFSGGAVSWFWAMYMVLTLEASLIMEKGSDTFAIALGGILAYGGLLMFEYYGLIRSVKMPFENNLLQQTLSYEIIKWAWVSSTNLCLAFIGVFMMKTVRDREEHLRQLVIKDSLTSLYNRRYFFYRLTSEIQRAKRYKRNLSLLILDVDDFKKYNDRYGHLEGDVVLRAISDTILSGIRRSDGKPSYDVDIACRYGGEELAVILPETDSAQGAVTAERLRGLIEKECDLAVARKAVIGSDEARGEVPGLTVSIGVASYPAHATDTEGLISSADKAMFIAKGTGKNRVVVSDSHAASPEPDRQTTRYVGSPGAGGAVLAGPPPK